MDAGRDSAEKIRARNVSGDERKRDRIDRCTEKATILLKDLDRKIGLRPRVKCVRITGSDADLMAAANSKIRLYEGQGIIKRLLNVM